jgi:succinyl-CoA synthetase beta subunit
MSLDVNIDTAMIAEITQTVNMLYQIFREKDCTLVEINPLVLTPHGVYAADAKIILDDNALYRHNIACNRDLSMLEQEAEKHGFSFVELDGEIGVIGNGAGLTMATLDLIHRHGRKFGIKPANFLDVGGGADQDRVSRALQMLEQLPHLKVIVINLLGGITRCDEVAKGILAADLSYPIMLRLAGTNEEEGKAILAGHGYGIYQNMEDAIVAAVLHVQQEKKNREECT